MRLSFTHWVIGKFIHSWHDRKVLLRMCQTYREDMVVYGHLIHTKNHYVWRHARLSTIAAFCAIAIEKSHLIAIAFFAIVFLCVELALKAAHYIQG